MVGHLEAHDLPAAHGLAIWATPVTEHRIAAASWTTHHQGWQIVCYRSTGADLPDELMTQLRTEIGWLIPIHTLHLRPDTTINSADPAAALVATWLLINQRIAKTARDFHPPAWTSLQDATRIQAKSSHRGKDHSGLVSGAVSLRR